jgi:hypothetical protein
LAGILREYTPYCVVRARCPPSRRPAGWHRTTKANIRSHRVRRTAGVESSSPSDFFVSRDGYINPSNRPGERRSLAGSPRRRVPPHCFGCKRRPQRVHKPIGPTSTGTDPSIPRHGDAILAVCGFGSDCTVPDEEYINPVIRNGSESVRSVRGRSRFVSPSAYGSSHSIRCPSIIKGRRIGSYRMNDRRGSAKAVLADERDRCLGGERPPNTSVRR